MNFPEVSLPAYPGQHRLLHIHRNQPGVLSEVNAIFSEKHINITGQFLQTNPKIGYVVIDIEAPSAPSPWRSANASIRWPAPSAPASCIERKPGQIVKTRISWRLRRVL